MRISQLVRDIINVSRKEFWELKHSQRHLYWLLAWILIPIMLIYWDTSRSLVPISLLLLYLPSLFALSTSSQIVSNIILGEKKAKTLEVLLSTRMPPAAIIIGKAIPATIIGFVLSQIGLLGLNAFSFLEGLPAVLSTTFFLSIFPIAAAYLSSCLTIMTTILVADEKIAPIPSTLLMFIPLFLLNYVNNLVTWTLTTIFFITIGLLLLCACLTWLAAETIKRIPLFTQI